MSKRHHVSFNAQKKVSEEVHVAFRTNAGEKVSFEAEKKVKEPVRVEFYGEKQAQVMCRNNLTFSPVQATEDCRCTFSEAAPKS